MTKTRADAWTDHQDDLLATIVLKHIQSGSQQLRAFEEASDELDRTSAACAFRWNATIKRGYEVELKKAFKLRRQHSRHKVASIPIETLTVEPPIVSSTLSANAALTARYEDVIDTLQEEKRQLLEYNRMLLQENKDLKEMRDSVLRILS
jgi:RsfA family transcription factor